MARKEYDYSYECERSPGGGINFLYRIRKGGFPEEYVRGEGWVNTDDAERIFRGEDIGFSASKEEAEEYVNAMESGKIREYDEKYNSLGK